MQDVLLSAFRHFDELRGPGKLQHYLLRAAHNRAVSLSRKRGKRPAALTEACTRRLRARGASPEQLMDVHLLYRAIDRLPQTQRRAILLFEIAGFSIREVATQLGKSEAAVKMLLQRGRAGLRRLLTDPQTGPSHRGELTLATLFLTAQIVAA